MKEIWIARFYKRRAAWKAVLKRADGVLYEYQDSKHLPKAISLIGEASPWEGNDEADMAVKKLAPAMTRGRRQSWPKSWRRLRPSGSASGPLI